ncbi:MAG: PHP domain-containing protein [Hungatella sp.]|jgi:predicted metal-dependent phosphoesterase TrpH|nr:PHP domain-containing protein [Hungatella sp.]
MNFVDLHTHSTASDGTLTPKEVVDRASSLGLRAIALTDHDTVDGIAQAKLAAAGSLLELIPGMELSCIYQGTEIHILGFFADETDKELKKGLDELRQVRARRNDSMLKRFQENGFAITKEDLMFGNPQTVITRAHFARVLTEKGYVPSPARAFEKYLWYGSPYCARKETVTPRQVMELMNRCRIWPCLAHPMQYHLGYEEVEKLAFQLKELGLRGLEVYHSSHVKPQSAKLQVMAKKLGLLPSGGSDFHGANKPDIELGKGRGGLRVTYGLLEDIKADYEAMIRPKS